MIADSEKYLSLATFRKNGKQVNTPVWFAEGDAGQLYCFSAADAGKVKRVRNSSAGKAARCDMRGADLGDWFDCNVTIITDASECDEAYRRLIRKYGWQMRITNFFSRLSGRINNRAVLRLDFS